MQLDDVPRWVTDEGLTVWSDRARVVDLESHCPKLVHRGLEVSNLDGEVLTQARRNGGLKQVELLRAEVDPGSGDPEIWSVISQGATESLGVEAHRSGDIGNVQRDVMDRERLDRSILAEEELERWRILRHR